MDLPTMFHDGDLNSGISQAISQGKLVACFVREEGEYWSRIWEEYWLQNLDTQWDEMNGPPLAQLLYDKAVILRIDSGTKEADFLHAFCPITTVPSFVVINNGKVLEKVEGGAGRDEFVVRVSKAVGIPVAPDVQRRADESTAKADEQEQHSTTEQQEEDMMDSGENIQAVTQPSSTRSPASSEQHTTASAPEAVRAPAQQNPPQQPPTQSSTYQNDNLQAVLAERAQRLEIDRLKREAAEKADRIARRRQEAEAAAALHRQDKGKQPATDPSADYKLKARADWIYQQKQRKDEAKKDRERILTRIENDKAERKLKAQRQKEGENLDPNATLSFAPESPLRSVSPDPRKAAQMSLIQVRLLDGSSIRSRFNPDTTTLAQAIRTWIKESASGNSDPDSGSTEKSGSYAFRHILPLQPARTIEVGEEQQTLRELGFAPSASLVLAPLAGSANSTRNVWGYFSALFSAVYGLIVGMVILIGQFLGLTGTVNSPPAPPAQTREGNAGSGSASGAQQMDDVSKARFRVKTLADQRAEAETKKPPTEFYNGNSSAFQGRGDKDDAEDDSKRK